MSVKGRHRAAHRCGAIPPSQSSGGRCCDSGQREAPRPRWFGSSLGSQAPERQDSVGTQVLWPQSSHLARGQSHGLPAGGQGRAAGTGCSLLRPDLPGDLPDPPPALQAHPTCAPERTCLLGGTSQRCLPLLLRVGKASPNAPKVQLCTSKFPSEIIAKRVPGTLG